MHDSSCRDTLRSNNKTTKESTARQNSHGSYQNAVKFGHSNNLKATAERRKCNDQTVSPIGGSNRTKGQNDDSYHRSSVYSRVNSRHSSATMRWDVSNPLSSQLQGSDTSSDHKTLKSTKKKKDDDSSTVFSTTTYSFESESRTTVQDVTHDDDVAASLSHCIGRSLPQKNDATIFDGTFDKTIIHHRDEETCVISWDDSYRKYISRKQDILLEEDRIWKLYLQKCITICEWYNLHVSLTNEINEMFRILCDITLALFKIDGQFRF